MARRVDQSPPGGRLTPERLQAVLDALATEHGFDLTDARLIKFTNSAVFDLPVAGLVIKIAGSRLVTDRIPKVVRVARWLESHGFPSVRLAAGVDQPAVAHGHAATVWDRVQASGPVPMGVDLARLIARFHRLPAPEGLAVWDPVHAIRQRLDDADGLEAADAEFLGDRCDQVEAQLAEIEPGLPAGPIHGDVFLGNLIPGPHGPVLCDFDSTSVGLREWDLTPVAVGSLRFAYPDDPQASFAAAYGFDVTTWPGFATLRRLRELQLVTSVVPNLRANPAIRPQFEHRLASLKAGDSNRWTPYDRAFRGT
jgi:hypothetical protein